MDLNEIMDLSLDDYIAISTKSGNTEIAKNKNHDKITFNSNNDAKFGRRKGNIDDEDEEDVDELMEPIKNELEEENHRKKGTDIWEGPDSSVSYLDCNDHRNDLREKLNNSSTKINTQKFSSVQYRMMAPNNAANRPRGIPTLLPMDAQVNNRNWVQHRGRKRNGGNRGYNNFQRNFNNAKNNVPSTYTGHGGGSVNNGRIQKNRAQDIESKNLRFSVPKNNVANTYTTARNMIMETPSSCINLVPSAPLKSSFQINQQAASERHYNSSHHLPIGNLTPQAEAVLNLNSMGAQSTSLSAGSSNENLKSLLGFQGNVSNEMMPVFASRLLDYIQSGLQHPTVHKPVYDMKIQKDIHEIQKKPLLYKCPGGEVVSSDGAGVNCKIIPRTSGLSLNCRFA